MLVRRNNRVSFKVGNNTPFEKVFEQASKQGGNTNWPEIWLVVREVLFGNRRYEGMPPPSGYLRSSEAQVKNIS